MLDINIRFFYDTQTESHCTQIKKQINKTNSITFGSPINILLITDRLMVCTKRLKEHLQNVSDVSVDLVCNLDEAIQVIQTKPIDFLVIVGYLKTKDSYKAVQIFEQINKFSCAIIYAILDEYIQIERLKYGIRYEFSRLAPIDGFILYLCDLYDKETQRMYKAVSPEASREQLRMDALHSVICVEEEQVQKPEKKGSGNKIAEMFKVTNFLSFLRK